MRDKIILLNMSTVEIRSLIMDMQIYRTVVNDFFSLIFLVLIVFLYQALKFPRIYLINYVMNNNSESEGPKPYQLGVIHNPEKY